MQKNKHRHKNSLDYYRRRMRFSTPDVAYLLGHQNSKTVADYERGTRLPTLINALKLSAILRTPVEFLFGELYEDLRNGIRAEEERTAQPRQAMLF